ncbi:MAG: repair RadC family protein [Alphaproteobacteria bacterium]|jgi:DNA repair protein RadC|nr:repair RadC family protein [Alphaproteobacteria bacterium]
MPKGEKITPEISHDGHRDRLRGRFIRSGTGALEDYELLELALFSAIPRRDVKPLAKQLLVRFGSMCGVLGATVDDLQTVKGISENTAVFIKTIHALQLRTLSEEIKEKPILTSWQKLIDYCHAAMAHEKREHFRVLFLNKKNQLIADEVQQVGTIDHVPVYPREVVKHALDLGATAMILVHNHPSGDPTPSDGDITMTRELVKAAKAMDVMVHDHIIIGKSGHTSFKAMGLM